MATFTISQAIMAIEAYGQKVADRAEAIMKEEVPVRTGKLRDSITTTKVDSSTWIIEPYATNEETGFYYPAAVKNGRRAIYKDPGALKIHGSLFKDPPKRLSEDGYFFTHYVGPTQPNDFIKRTIDRLEKEHIEL